MRGAPVAAAVALALGGCVSAPADGGAVMADRLTVSGRHALPSAAPDGWLARRLSVGGVVLADGAAAALKLDPAELQTRLGEAFARSLANHGYAAPADQSAASPIQLIVAAPTITTDDAAAVVVVEMSFRADPADPDAACLTHATRTRFRAVKPLDSGGGERAAAVVSTALMAAVGVPPGVFMAEQFRNASAENAALNARRPMTSEEAVTPRGQAAAQFAGVHALRLGLADYIARLGAARACLTP